MAPEDVCREVYSETRTFYETAEPRFHAIAAGFRVLYGPPVVKAPILVLGFQPGGGREDAEAGIRDGEHEGWPSTSDYATKDWPLARRLREMCGAAAIDGSTGLNAIFFRARSVREWYRMEAPMRTEAERFSLSRAERIVRALSPKRLLVIGLGTFDRLGGGEIAVRTDRRVLAKEGELWGAPAVGIVHLSGARISRHDRERLTAYVRTV